jgi:hypothetical protein
MRDVPLHFQTGIGKRVLPPDIVADARAKHERTPLSCWVSLFSLCAVPSLSWQTADSHTRNRLRKTEKGATILGEKDRKGGDHSHHHLT